MNTILFVTGAVGTGKSTFIEKSYVGKDGFYVLDLVKISMDLFGTMDAFEDDRLADIYNQATDLAMDALMDEMVLVVEYCLTEAYDDDFVSLIKEAKLNGSRVEIVQLRADQAKIVQRLRNPLARKEKKSSLHFREYLIEIVNGIVECLGINQKMETICKLAWEGSSISLFKAVEEKEDCFFYISDDIRFFDFLEEGVSEELPGIDHIQKFKSFDEALEDLHAQFNIYSLYPVKIHVDYLRRFKAYYMKHLKIGQSPLERPVWQKFLN